MDVGHRMSEIGKRRRKSEVGMNQTSDVGGRKSARGRRRSDVGGRTSEVIEYFAYTLKLNECEKLWE